MDTPMAQNWPGHSGTRELADLGQGIDEQPATPEPGEDQVAAEEHLHRLAEEHAAAARHLRAAAELHDECVRLVTLGQLAPAGETADRALAEGQLAREHAERAASGPRALG
jgi:hypothetical protein